MWHIAMPVAGAVHSIRSGTPKRRKGDAIAAERHDVHRRRARVHRCGFGNDRARAAGRARFVVGGERLARMVVGDHHRQLAGREDTVLDGGAAYGERRKRYGNG
jgi:hypothetical protein